MKVRRLLLSIAAAGMVSVIEAGPAIAGTNSANVLQPENYKVVHQKVVQVGDAKLFYREAGNPSNPSILLLHGFPTSSLMYRNLIPILADKYHVVAPDLPGFGYTESPDRSKYEYTFDNLAKTIDQFTVILKLNKYAIQVFDYGAPVGWRLASAHPERITAIITQNGNAYAEGLSTGWEPIQKYWKDPSEANRNALRGFLTPESIQWQYITGVKDPSKIASEAYTIDADMVARPGNADIQLDLFKNYATNVARYPEFQAYFRKHQPPLLAVWGKHAPFFLPPGAEAFKRDNSNAEVHLYDTGHFALETHVNEIGNEIHKFLDKNVGHK